MATVAELCSEVSAEFSRQGALGVLFVDCAALDEVEARYGEEAHARALAALADVLGGASLEVLGRRVPLARGELGRGELVAFVAHAAGDGDFHGKQLPALERASRERIARNAQRIAYPYLRRLPALPIGAAFTLRNPILAPLTQIRAAIDRARADAELNARLVNRAQRREFIDILLQGKLHSVYEPVVDAKSLTVFGYEALVRGNEGTTLTSPAQLFSVAAEEGLLFELDCQCRRAAVEGAAGFPAGAKLFMNIRPTAIHDPNFQPDALTRTLDRCGLAPGDVVFEISEQESIDNYAIFREARDNYGKLGFQFALDDTGAGYASLEAVLELTPEYIKVDRAFVHGIDQDSARQNMLRAFQTIASDMNARIIGEGLDTLEELRTLGALGIQFGQGWLFGKPAPLRAGE
ncbi:MAG TPA: EAL domain-containing protein [Myxococcota bacterium]|nr:EAL domain-containing protein [Myxococcota bacterium]